MNRSRSSALLTFALGHCRLSRPCSTASCSKFLCRNDTNVFQSRCGSTLLTSPFCPKNFDFESPSLLTPSLWSDKVWKQTTQTYASNLLTLIPPNPRPRVGRGLQNAARVNLV